VARLAIIYVQLAKVQMADSPDSSSHDPGGAERRAYSRHELMASVHVRHAAVDHVLELGNISRSGALVLLGSLPTPMWMTLGRQVELLIFALVDDNELLPSEYRDPCVAHGKIVRIHGGHKGFGVHFDEDSETKASIARLMQRIAVQPVNVPRP